MINTAHTWNCDDKQKTLKKLGGIFVGKNLDHQTLFIVLEQILNDCEDGVSESLVALLKSKPDLFYIVLNVPSKFTPKHTNVLNHIISYRNFALLNRLIEVGLKDVLKDVFEKTQYNILYTDYPNALIKDDMDITLNIKESKEWDPLLNLLMKNNLLPNEKIDKFSWAIMNKPNTLMVAFETKYFEQPHQEYWEQGLNINSKSWIMIDFINSILLNDLYDFKNYCVEDFDANGLNDITGLNNKMCFYLPDFYIFHDLDKDLNDLIALQKIKMKKLLSQRVFKIKKDDLNDRIYSIFQDSKWINNWIDIHKKYENPWDFLAKKEFLNNQTYIEVNSLDYAFLCQSIKSYQIIEELLGSESMLESHLDVDTPKLVRSFLFSNKLNKNLSFKAGHKKIVKI